MRATLSRLLLSLFVLAPVTHVHAQDADAKSEEKEDAAKDELTLERLFPEKSFFGPSARSVAFSHDGRYAAWLWRPYLERRHGSDLYVHDFESGETRRVTSATVLAPFQKQTREVVEDRIEKAKKRAAEAERGDAKKDEKDGAEEKKKDAPDEVDGDTVGEDDAEDEDAPRYGGVSSYTWAPAAAEMLVSTDGDVYRWSVDGEGLERLTRTREREGRVEYLPDGSGFLYQSNGALLRLVFGSHLVEQVDPPLNGGREMSGFRLSPDGKKVALVARKGDSSFMAGGRTVNIADYGDRFMKVREVPRHVSDDPLPPRETTVLVYELPEPMRENGTLYELHTFEHSGPRDVVGTPDWAPDSSRVTFSTFQQKTGQVEVLEAVLPEKEKPEAEEGEAKGWDALVAKAKAKEKGGDEKKDEKESAEDAAQKAKKKDSDIEELPARVVYRFLHEGGPNTPRMVEPRYAFDSRRIVFLTEQTGFRHLGILDPLYEHLEPLTRGAYEVYLQQVPEHRRWVYVTSTREDPSCLDVYRVDLEETGDMTRLTSNPGRYESVAVSPDGTRLLASFQAYGRLRELVAVDVEAKKQVDLTDSHPDEARALTKAVPEMFSFENRHGHTIHGMLFKPEGWKKDEKRPLLLYVYGGPLGTRKEIVQGSYSGSGYFFANYMAQEHGYLTCTIDPRGMSGYGAVFEKANFEQVGKPQVEDLVDGVRHVVEEYGADPERVGMHGWSFGGFQTQMCLYSEPDVFACGIAGAGPTEWENYNSWYSTGTIGDSRTGEPDLEKYSLLPLAKNLKARLLLVHGMEDSNVLYQDTVRVYGELLKAGKETLVELFLDPSGGHGLGGHVKALGRYRKYEEFLVRCLGEGPTAATPR